jgi:FkbH-like protein
MTTNLNLGKQPLHLVDLLRQRAQNQPDTTAYIFLQDGEAETDSFTYRELDQQAQVIAASLQPLAAPGERALLLYPSGLEFIAAFFGCLYAGVIAVPAYPPRRNQKMSRLQALVEDSQTKIALTTKELLPSIESRFAEERGLAEVSWLATDNIASQEMLVWQEPVLNSNTLAFLQYTSGSTGTPKGVMVSHGNLLHNSEYIKQAFELTPDSVSVSWLPSFHDMGLIDGILQPLYTGFLGVLMPPTSFVQRPLQWLQAISRYKATHCGGPNFGYELCINNITPEQRNTLDLSSWCSAYSGAEPIRRETLKRFSATFESCGFRPNFFYPCYGMAEATLMVSGGMVKDKPVYCALEADALQQNRIVKASGDTENVMHLVGCGRAWLDTNIAIVDPESLTRCAPDQVGEIWVSGSSIAQGYWNQPEQTQETFQARLSDTDIGPFLRTGDLGFLHDGELFVTGRLKDLIIIRGRNHYPQDIELTVERSHPALRPTCGAAFSIEVDGEEQLAIAQEIDRQYLRKLNVDEVVKEIRRAVIEHHELEVHTILLLKTVKIPKTSSGKIQRRACKANFLANSLDIVGSWHKNSQNKVESQQQIEEVKTQSQQQLTSKSQSLPNKSEKASKIQAWIVSKIAERLQVNPPEIDIEAPFVNYGLDSVATVRFVGELENWLGQKLSPTMIYDYPSIAALVLHLSGELDASEQNVKVDAPQQKTTTHPSTIGEPIAIIGLGCRFPGANDPEAFWQLLRNGVDVISEVPKNRWDINSFYHPELETPGKMSTRWGAFLDQVDQFDPNFFGISPREAERMDPQQRILLEVAWEALENAGIVPSQLAGSETGVFIGISNNDYSRIQFENPTRIDAYAGTGNAFSIAANRLSYLLDLRGPSLSVDTACSSSLVAIHLACQSLQTGESNLALVGGVNLILTPELTITFSQAHMMAADGRCKTFDNSADGYVRGEGCGIVVLKRLSDALRDKDNILSLIKGSAVNQDGRSNGLTAPNGPSQQIVIRKALQKAGITADQLSYVEAHGTGTPIGDPIEIESLKAVLTEDRLLNQPCLIGSVKTNIGHLEAAAGIAGLIKVVLSLKFGEIFPHLHLKHLNPLISLQDSPLSIPTYLQPWSTKSRRRFAGVSSFGFGGTNAHVVLENAPEQTLETNKLRYPSHLLTLSAKSERALRSLARRCADFLASHSEVSLADICFTSNTGRSHFVHRLTVIAESTAQLHEQLSTFAASQPVVGVVSGKSHSSNSRKIAFLFTDCDSGYLELGYQLYQTQPSFRQALEHCDLLLRRYLEKPLLSVLYSESGVFSPLEETEYLKPASFAVQYALAKLWQSWGILPTAVIGYGVGEYVAACIAQATDLENCVQMLLEPSALNPSEKMAVVFTESDMVKETVQLAAVAETLVKQGYNLFIEVGNNSTVHDPSQETSLWLATLKPGQNSWQVILNNLSILYIQGVDINWTDFHRGFTYQRIPLPTYPFERKRYWLERTCDATKPTVEISTSKPNVGIVKSDKSGEQRLTSDALLALKQEEQQAVLQSYLCEQLALVLGYSIPKLDVDLPITNFGIDSLMSLQLKKRIESDLKVVVPETKFLQGPSITQLTTFLFGEMTGFDSTATLTNRQDETGDRPTTESTHAQIPFPLSFPQERMWLLNHLSPGNPVYNFQMAVRLSGQLNIKVLEQSIQEVVNRHEILRTTFPVATVHPVQVIAPKLHLPLSIVDLSEVVKTQQAIEVEKFAASEVQQPFDLTQGPLLRTSLLRLDQTEHVFVLTIHHIISDYWSMRVFIQEIGELYDAHCNERLPSLAKLNFQYKDFVNWQQQSSQGEIRENQLAYWKKKLALVPPALELPLDQPRPANRSFRGATQFFNLSPSLSQSLQEFSRQEGVTLFMTLMAVFKTLLYCYTEQEDILLGSPVSGRTHAESENLIGMFSYPLVLRTDLSGNPTFKELLVRVREVALEAYVHQNVPFAKVVEIAESERNSDISLVQVMFSFTSRAMNTTQFSNLVLEPVEIDRGMTDFDWFLTMFEEGGGLRGALEYDTDIFTQETISQVVEHFQILLETVLTQTNRPLSELVAKIPVQKKLRMAIASTFTAEPIRDSLNFWMQELKIPNQIEFAPYNQVFQQLLDPTSLLSKNQNGVNVILIRLEDWLRYEEESITETDSQSLNIQEKITQNIQDLLLSLKSAVERSTVPYLVCVCPVSPNSQHVSLFSQLEKDMTFKLEAIPGVYVVTTETINETYPIANYYDVHGDKLGHIPFTNPFFTALGTIIARKIRRIKSPPYKVIVVDADETLWKGICGEDGVTGIQMTPSYQTMQSFLVKQYEAGMLICLCSKNNEADVLAVFEQRPDMILKLEHIVSYRVNWQPKSENIKSLSQELQLSLEHFIFIDDNPVECAEVKTNCPEVLTLQLPTADDIPKFIEHVWAFDTLKITEEDKRRTALYQENLQRERLRTTSLTFADFIASLDLQIQISSMTEQHLGRVAQLTQRTNQFNTTTIRRSETEIQQLCSLQNFECLTISVKDRFGDYGLVGVVIFKVESDALEVDSFLLSCRVLGRGVEHQMLTNLGEIAKTRQVDFVKLHYVPTVKNQPVLSFLESVGSQFREQSDEGLCLKLPVQVATSITYGTKIDGSQTLNGTSKNTSSLLPQNGSSSAKPRNYSAIFTRIATQLCDIEQVHKTIQERQQRKRQNIAATDYVLPQTKIEQEIAAIWKEVLHIENIGVNDNFFNLGGRSLQVVQVNGRLREVLGKEIPLVDMFQYTTIRALVKYLNPNENPSQNQNTAFTQSRSRGERRRQLMQIKK